MPAPTGPHCPSCWGPGDTHNPGCPVLHALHYGLVDHTGTVTAYPSRAAAERDLGPRARIVRRIGLRPNWRGLDGCPAETIAAGL